MTETIQVQNGFQCLPDCGRCCGLVGIPEDVVKRYEHLKQREVKEIILSEGLVYAMTEDGICVFLSPEKKCVIYGYRPKICEDYGVTEDVLIQCPYMKPNGSRRSEAKQKRFIRMLDKTTKQTMRNLEIKLKRSGQNIR